MKRLGYLILLLGLGADAVSQGLTHAAPGVGALIAMIGVLFLMFED